MANPPSLVSSAFNVERARAKMWENVRVPSDFLQKAIDTVHQKLDAKKTIFFSHQGQVQEQVDVVDHATQLDAVDKVLKMTGAYVKERDERPSQPSVAIQIDSSTGVIRLVIGEALTQIAEPTLLAADGTSFNSETAELPSTVKSSDPANVSQGKVEAPETTPQWEEAPPQVIKVKRGNLPVDVHKALFGD